MKKLLLHCVLFSLLTSTFATDYQCFQPHRKAYYRSNQMRVVPIVVDSVVNTELFFNRTLQLAGDYCFVEKGAGWLGEKMKIDSAWNYFFTIGGDTVRVKTDARLNESWTLYRKNTMTIEATVTSHDTLTLSGFSDSVKTIGLKVYDATMKPLPHRLDGTTIELSKSRGIVKGVPFFHFPDVMYESALPETTQIDLTGLTHPTEGDNLLSWREVNDFQEGDEFHYTQTDLFSGQGGFTKNIHSIYKILNRWEIQDTVFYKREVRWLKNVRYVNSAEPEISYYTGNDTLKITPNPVFDREPGIPYYEPEYAAFDISLDFGFKSTLISDHYTRENNCWQQGILIDDVCNYTLYARGRGLISASSGCWVMWSSSSTEQVYYKKAGMESGEPLVITGTAAVDTENPRIKLIDNTIRITTHTTGAIFILRDPNGRELLKMTLHSGDTIIDTQHFPKGIILYTLIESKQMRTGKISHN